MDELDQGGTLDMLLTLVLEGIRGQQVQNGAQAFPATVDNVLANLVDQDHIGTQSILDALIDARHVAFNQGINFFNFHRLRGSDSCLRLCMLGPRARTVKPGKSGLTLTPGAAKIAALYGGIHR